MRHRPLLLLGLLLATTGCVGPLQSLQPYAPLVKQQYGPEHSCEDLTETTVDEHGNAVQGPAAANCRVEVSVLPKAVRDRMDP